MSDDHGDDLNPKLADFMARTGTTEQFSGIFRTVSPAGQQHMKAFASTAVANAGRARSARGGTARGVRAREVRQELRRLAQSVRRPGERAGKLAERLASDAIQPAIQAGRTLGDGAALDLLERCLAKADHPDKAERDRIVDRLARDILSRSR